MIQVVSIAKTYGSQVLLQDASFSINAGEKIGLLGRNGHGKTTLLRIIAGKEEFDNGQITAPEGYRIGYLSQHLEFTKDTALKEAALGLAREDEAWEQTHEAEAVLHGLGFEEKELSQDPSLLSGGYQVRLNLAKLLVSEPDLLLLDEPTNYLDIVSLRWLIRFLQKWKGELLLVTHDQEFMNKVITHTVGIHRTKLRKINGKTHNYYEQIEQEEAIHEQTRLNQEKKRQKDQEFIDRFRAKATKARQVQSRIKTLEKSEFLDKLEEIRHLHFWFNSAPFPGKWFLKAKDLSFGFNKDETPLFSGLGLSVGANDRIAVVGKNGKGKTTLLRLLVNELEPLSGSINTSPNIKLGYFGQTNIDRLNPEHTVEEEILSVEPSRNIGMARRICGAMMFEKDMALKKTKVLSGGEKSRVLLGKLLVSPTNFLVLDEPTNHLDMQSTNAFCTALETFPGAVVMVTHSEMLLRRLATRLIVFDEKGAFLFEGGYEDFLERLGWKDEENLQEQQSTSGAISKKQLRQLRGQIIERRSKELSPLKNQIAAIEKKIIELEAAISEHNDLIVKASAKGEGEVISELSQQLHTDQQEAEELYDELDTLTQDYETKNEAFEKELEEID